MYTSLGVAAMLVALLVVMFYSARMLLPLISPRFSSSSSWPFFGNAVYIK
jgi:hypothetical protein